MISSENRLLSSGPCSGVAFPRSGAPVPTQGRSGHFLRRTAVTNADRQVPCRLRHRGLARRRYGVGEEASSTPRCRRFPVAFAGPLRHIGPARPGAGPGASGCSSGVEHNLAKVGVEGSNPFARSSSPNASRPRNAGAFSFLKHNSFSSGSRPGFGAVVTNGLHARRLDAA